MKRILAPWAKPINLFHPHLNGNCLHTLPELLKAGKTQRENRIKHGRGRNPPAWRACEQIPTALPGQCPQGQGARPALISPGRAVPSLPPHLSGAGSQDGAPRRCSVLLNTPALSTTGSDSGP